MDKVLNMTYSSSLTNLCEINTSFDTGVLRICYTGPNRNGSYFSKEALERCIPTIYNCPIVCNYDRETDSLGGHDIEVVKNKKGDFVLVNLTQPVGVIPESANVWFETVQEKDGSKHEYLCADVLIWKRQESYKKIKDDGITKHSMEVTVKDGEEIDGYYHIKDFEFTAFCLLGVEPCFESSALEFSKKDLKDEFALMMKELKETFSAIDSTDVDEDKDHCTEGGKMVLENEVFEMEEEVLEESTEKADEPVLEESAEEAFEEAEPAEEAPVEEPAEEEKFDLDPEEAGEDDDDEAEAEEDADAEEEPAEEKEDKFALTSNILDEIHRKLEEVTVEKEWGKSIKYWYVDCDFDLNEVYVEDTEDWLLYGFKYTVSGDSIEIDFESKSRKKFVIADYEDGSPDPSAAAFEAIENIMRENAEISEKFNAASDTIDTMKAELDDLRQFKADTESAVAESARKELFERFNDLVGVEEFEALQEKASEYDLEVLEEKCYAIRGKTGSFAKFSAENKAPKLKVAKTETKEDKPYGGLVEQYTRI